MAKLLSGTRIYGTANVDTQINVGANAVVNTSALFLGNSTVNATITSSSIITQGTIATGNASITGFLNVSSTANIGGVISARSDLVVNGAVTVANNTTITGFINVASTANVGGAITARSDVTVNGALTVANNTTITGFINVASTANVGGAINARSTLTVNGALTVANTAALGNTTITGDATVTGNITAANLRTTGNVQIDGNFVVSGNTITIGVTNLAVSDNIIYLNEPEVVIITSATSNGTAYIYTANNGYSVGEVVTVTGMTPSGYNISANTITAANSTAFAVANTSAPGAYVSGGSAVARVDSNPDVGFAANYNDGTYRHAGFFRDATDGVFKVFDQYVPEPSGAFIDTANNTFRIADFQSNNTVLGTANVAGTTNLGTGSANYLRTVGAAAGLLPIVSAQGTDTNIGQVFQTKGTGGFDIAAGSSGVNISNGNTVTAVIRTAFGSGYTTLPTWSASVPTTAGGVQATGQAASLLAVSATVGAGGTGYTVNDVLTLVGGTFTTATTVTVSSVSGGVVTGVLIVTNGTYTAAPSSPASTTGGTGTGCTINISYGVNTVSITNAGSGYVEQPTITFSGGSGSGAGAYATVGSIPKIQTLGSALSFYLPGGEAFRILDTGANTGNYWQAMSTTASAILRSSNNVNNAQIQTSGTGGVLLGTNGGVTQFAVAHTASAVNYLQATGDAVGFWPTLSAQGADTNIGMKYNVKGSGAHSFSTGGGSATQLYVYHTASAVNYLQVTGSATGGGPTISVAGTDANVNLTINGKGTGYFNLGSHQANYWQLYSAATGGTPSLYTWGSDTNVGMNLITKGTGALVLGTNGGGSAVTQFQISHTASAVNYVQATGATTTNSPVLSAQGSDSNIGISLQGKGTGYPVIYTIASVGGTATNTQTLADIKGAAGGNVEQLRASLVRHTTGSDWTGVGYRFGHVVDVTPMSYIEFNPVGQSQGLAVQVLGNAPFQVKTSGGEQLRVADTSSAVNYLQVTGAATGVAPSITAQGTDTNISMSISTKGTSQLYLAAGSGGGSIRMNATGAEQVTISGPASAVNKITLKGAISGSTPLLQTSGSDANVGFDYSTTGTGAHSFWSNDVNGGTGALQFRVQHTASATNYVQATGAATGFQPVVSAQGTDANVGLAFSTKGTGRFDFYTQGVSSRQLSIINTSSAVNYLQITGSTTGAGPTYSAQGSDTNVDLNYVSKGTGVHNFSTGGGLQLKIIDVASAVNYPRLSGAATGAGPALYWDGADAAVTGVYGTRGAGGHLFYTNGNPQFRVGDPGATSVNYLQVTGAATGAGPIISSQGSDAAINLALTSKAGGDLLLQTGGSGGYVILRPNSISTLRAVTTASGVNYFQMAAGATGAGPTVSAIGTDTNIDINYTTKGTGNHKFNSGFGTEFLVYSFGSTVANYWSAVGTATGASPYLFAQGSDTNVDGKFTAKGSGSLRSYTNGGSDEQFRVAHTANAVNLIQVNGANTGNSPTIFFNGNDTNISGVISTKGAGGLSIYTNSNSQRQLRVIHTASAVNFLDITGAATGGAPSIVASAGSSDANVGITFAGKGTGTINLNSNTTFNANVMTFTGSNTAINLRVVQDGTLSFEGGAGQLFSISNNMTGQIFAVNDISGIPSIEVYANGQVNIAKFGGNVSIGTSTSTTTVNGAVAFANAVTFANTLAVTGAVTFSNTITSNGALTLTAGGAALSLSNTSTAYINFGAGGYAAPTATSRSTGAKLVLFSALSSTSTDYALGVEGNYLWFSAPNSATDGFKWYANTTTVMTANAVVLAVNANANVAGNVVVSGTSFGVINQANVSFVANGTTGDFKIYRDSIGSAQYIKITEDAGGGIITSISTNTNQKPLVLNATGGGNTAYDFGVVLQVETSTKLSTNATAVRVYTDFQSTNGNTSLGNTTITGNLTVTGTTTYVNTTNLNIGDNIITLNADLGAVSPTENAGIEVNRGTSTNTSLYWDETNKRWTADVGNSSNSMFVLLSNTYVRTIYTDVNSGLFERWGTPAAPSSLGEFSISGGVTKFDTKNRDYFIANGSVNTAVFAANGNVGIGTATPFAPLHVYTSVNGNNPTAVLQNLSTGSAAQAMLSIRGDTSTTQLDIGVSSNTYGGYGLAVANGAYILSKSVNGLGIFADNAASYIRFGAGGTSEGMRLNANGGLYVGTTGDLYGRQWSGLFNKNQNATTQIGVVNSNTGAAAEARFSLITGTGNSYVDWGLVDAAGVPTSTMGYGSAVGIFKITLTNTNGSFKVGNTTSTALHVSTANGNVGIGNAAPTDTFVVTTNSNTVPSSVVALNANTDVTAQAIVKVTQGSTSVASYVFGGAAYTGTITNNSWYLVTNNSIKAVVSANGNVGIGNNTPIDKLRVEGTLSHLGLVPSTGTGIDQIYTATPSITLNTTWQSTGVTATSLANGSYMVQLFANDVAAGGTANNEYYTGMMSWYSGDVNSTVIDEIPLHRAGVSGSNNSIFLATQRTPTANTSDLILMISSAANNSSSSTYTLKFRRMI